MVLSPENLWSFISNNVPALGCTHFLLEPSLGGGDAGRHRALRRAEGKRDLAIAVAMVVTQDDGGCLGRGQAAQRADQVVPAGQVSRIGSRLRPAQPAQKFPHLPQPLVA